MTTINTKKNLVNLATILKDDPITALQEAAGKDPSAISFNALVSLKKEIGFTRIRFKCSQGDKELDMETTDDAHGRAVVDYFTSNVAERPDACNSVIGNGGSELLSRCSEWGGQSGKWGFGDQFGDQRLYGVLAHILDVRFLSMGATNGRYECDSAETDEGGNWKIFVR